MKTMLAATFLALAAAQVPVSELSDGQPQATAPVSEILRVYLLMENLAEPKFPHLLEAVKP